MRASLSALVVAAVLMLSGCAAPPIAKEVAHELQSEVQEIAVLTARGDTADAVAAAHALAARVRTAQAEGQITGERAVTILQRVEQLIERLVRSGAAPAPAGAPQPVAGSADPAALPAEPEPTDMGESQPTEEADPPKTREPVEAPDPTEAPDPVEPTEPVEPVEVPDAAEPAVAPANPESSGSGSSGSGPGAAVPVPVIVDAADDDDDDDDDGGKGRGRGRSDGD
jgi:outer membrane biosynthesis protein TonB